ncbi:MAG TPA: hypothetical protein VIK86_07965 [Candidatus Paceibacterota bacterium]
MAIEADSTQYILGDVTILTKKIANSEEKIPYEGLKNPRYYTTPDAAVKACASTLIRREVANNDITTLNDFLVRFESLKIEIKDLLKGLEV